MAPNVNLIAYPQANAEDCLQYDGGSVLRLPSHQPERQALEKQLLDEAVVQLPLHHRVSWAQAQPSSSSSFFVGTIDASGLCVCGFSVDIGRSRLLPGHVVWRVRRFGSARNEASRTAALQGLVHYARRDSRVLRVHLEVFSRDPHLRDSVARVARTLGFVAKAVPRMYAETICIDLHPSESEILASFHGTARRHVRAVEKTGTELRVIENPGYSEKMTALVRETMARTGGRPEQRDWPMIIDFSRRHPELSRLIGLHRLDTDGPEALLAFAWGRFHGDYVDYAAAASTRKTDLKMAFGYAPAWDLIRWAKRLGAVWFDFGGITPGSFYNRDPLGGISDFKRYFGGEVISVGEEWVLEPQPVKAMIANKMGAGIAWARKLIISRS